MDIKLYLSECLKTHKQVGVTGLGTFLKKKTPGKYDAALHQFVPPSYELSFVNTVLEDTALANYISSKRNITVDSAQYYITEFAEQTNNILSDNQEADLGDIGMLRIVKDEVSLIPNSEANFGFEYYGLPPISEVEPKAAQDSLENTQLEEITIENILDEENPGDEANSPIEPLKDVNYKSSIEETTEPVSVSPIVEESVIEPTELEEDFIDEPKKGMSFLMKFLLVLLIIVIAGAIAYFINPKFFDKYIQQNSESKPKTSIPIAAKDTLSSKIDSPKVDSVANNSVAHIPKVVAIDSTKMIYEVLGTSESSSKAADNYIARVAKKGIIAKQLRFSKQRFSVSLGTFNDEKQAIQYRDSVRILLKNPQIYVKTIKPKKTKI